MTTHLVSPLVLIPSSRTDPHYRRPKGPCNHLPVTSSSKASVVVNRKDKNEVIHSLFFHQEIDPLSACRRMGRSRILQSTTKERGTKNLIVLLIFLICWGFTPWSLQYSSMVLVSDNKTLKEEVEFNVPVDKAKHYDSNPTIFQFTSNSSSTPLSSMRHSNFTFDFPLCLVHVGKAAGSSLSCGLGLMYADCEGMPRDPPLPNTFYFHLKKDTCRRVVESQDAKKNKKVPVATYLLPIRNPLTRIQSWFQFEKDIVPVRRNKREEDHFKWKRGMLFVECYDNFVDLVLDGLKPELWNANIAAEQPINMTCPERAWAAVLGVREFSYHEWYNYEYYWTALQTHHPRLFDNNSSNGSSPNSASLVALRTEHLLEDWSALSKEPLYRPVNQGSRKEFRQKKDETNQSIVFSNRSMSDNTLGKDRSSTFWRNLCHAMCPEIQIYTHILRESINLRPPQVDVTLQELRELCPDETTREGQQQCSGIPQFPLMRVPRRQYKPEVKKRLFTVG